MESLGEEEEERSMLSKLLAALNINTNLSYLFSYEPAETHSRLHLRSIDGIRFVLMVLTMLAYEFLRRSNFSLELGDK